MGWGLVAASRAQLFDKCTVLKDPLSNDFTICDMCAEGRRMAVGPTPRSAAVVAKGICRTLWKKTNKCLVLLFDDSRRMHPIRAELHGTRYKPRSEEALAAGVAAGKVAVNGQLYAPDMLPYTARELSAFTIDSKIVWPRMWSSKIGKAKAFELIRNACVVWHHGNDIQDGSCVLWHEAEPITYPYDSAEAKRIGGIVSQNNFGEADFRVGEAVKDLALEGSVFIQTIDTDMIIQMQVSKGIMPSSTVHLRLLNETLNIGDMTAVYGADNRNQRLTAGFFFLSAGGVDYCRGLTRFGFVTKGLLMLAGELHECVTAHNATATLHAHALLQLLKQTKQRRCYKYTWQDFEDELHRIMFCLSLFTGAMKKREPFGGPDVTNTSLFAPQSDNFVCSDVGFLDASQCTDLTVLIDE